MARTKGAKNRMTIAIKDAVQRCFEQVNINNAYLLDLAENEKALFVSLISKCIPNQVALDVQISLDLGLAMAENQQNLNRLNAIKTIEHENVLGTDDNPTNEPPAKSLKTKDSTK